MENDRTELIRTAAAKAIDSVAERAGVCGKTVRTEITKALKGAAQSGNVRMLALEKANGAPLLPEDAVEMLLMRFVLTAGEQDAKDGQN